MNILFTVCGRAGSKGVKNKNMKSFLGYPLVCYSLEAIKLYVKKYGCGNTIHTCLNTDSSELIALVTKVMPEVFVVYRDAKLCGDFVSKLDVIKDCYNKSVAHFSMIYDVIVDLDITSPFRTIDDIKAAIDKNKSSETYDVVFSVTPSRRNPYFNMVKLEPDGTCKKVIASDYTARQQAPQIFDMNASIYAYSPSFLKESRPAITSFIEMMDTAVLDIDTEEDLELMQHIAMFVYSKYPAYNEIYQSVINN